LASWFSTVGGVCSCCCCLDKTQHINTLF
jgi:hypothetical protein